MRIILIKPPSLHPVTVVDFRALTADVFAAKLQLSTESNFHFSAGQYLNLAIDKEDKRPFSIASTPDKLPYIDLHIQRQPENPFTEEVLRRLKLAEPLAIEGPFGQCAYPHKITPHSNKPWVFIVGGTGFAPAKAILETSFDKQPLLHAHLFWGVGSENELYAKELPQSWNEKQHFSFHPVIFNPNAKWQGLIGLVHKAAMNALANPLKSYEYYLAGSAEMVLAVYEDLQISGVAMEQIHGDMLDLMRADGTLV